MLLLFFFFLSQFNDEPLKDSTYAHHDQRKTMLSKMETTTAIMTIIMIIKRNCEHLKKKWETHKPTTTMPPFPLFAISNRTYQAAQTAILARSSSTGREQTNTHTHKKKNSQFWGQNTFFSLFHGTTTTKKSDWTPSFFFSSLSPLLVHYRRLFSFFRWLFSRFYVVCKMK